MDIKRGKGGSRELPMDVKRGKGVQGVASGL